MKKTIVLAESFDQRWQSLSYVHPFSGEYVEVSGEIVDFTSHSNTYYHMTDNGDFETRNWFDEDITHVVAACDECEEGYFEVLVPVNF